MLNIDTNTRSLLTAPAFSPYSKVIVEVSDDVSYTAGDDTGRTLTVPCPWGTQQMADDILAQVAGFSYQPFTASGAMPNPAAELGDGITASGISSGIFSARTTFGRRLMADLSAPCEEEIDHEFPYKPPSDRKVKREIAGLSAELTVQNGLIAAKVSQTGGNAQSFGWDLNATSWELKTNNATVLKATKNGLEINGTGTFTGDIYAENGYFHGNVYAGNIEYGGDAGRLSGSGISTGSIYGNRLVGNTVTTSCTSEGINNTLGYADWCYDALTGSIEINVLYAYNLYASAKLFAKGISLDGHNLGRSTITYKNSAGNTASMQVVIWEN